MVGRTRGADASRRPRERRQAGRVPQELQPPTRRTAAGGAPGRRRPAPGRAARQPPSSTACTHGAKCVASPDRQPGADRAAGPGRRTARPVAADAVGDDGGARRQQQPADQPQPPRQPAAAQEQQQHQHEPRRQEEIGGEAESADQGAGDPGAGQAEEVVRRGMERVDAFVEVGRVVAGHGEGEEQAEEQQDAGGGVETPGATIRHGAETPVAAAVGAGKLAPRFLFIGRGPHSLQQKRRPRLTFSHPAERRLWIALIRQPLHWPCGWLAETWYNCR